MNLDRHDASADRHLRLLPSDPIGFLYWHHYSQAICCELFVRLADNLNHRRSEEEAGAVLHYIRHELPLHELDEEQDLHWLVTAGQAAGTDTRIDRLFSKLIRQHRTDRELSEALLDGLTALAAGKPPSRPHGFIIKALQLAESLRRHVRWENRVFIPLVTQGLTRRDRLKLGQRLTARREARLPPVEGAVIPADLQAVEACMLGLTGPPSWSWRRTGANGA